MNSNGDFPRRHRDTRDRSRIMRRLGFRADSSSASEQQNTGRVPSSGLHKNHRKRSTDKRDRSHEQNYSHPLPSRNGHRTNLVSSQRRERKQREDVTSSSSSRSSSPYSPEDTTHSRKHRRRHHHRRRHGRRHDRSYSPQHDNHQDAQRSGEQTTYAANISSRASAASFQGFAIAILRILIRMDPFRWLPRFAKMDAKAIQKQIMDVGYNFSLVKPTEKESFGDSLVGEAYKSLQHLRPDDQCLYRVVISQRRERAIFANVQSSLHPSPSQTPRAFWRYQKENDLVHPGSRVYLSPSPRMHMELPSLGGIVVPYRLPGSISELTNMEYQQPVVRGVTRDTKPMTSEQYVTQISVPPPQPDTSAQHKRCPSVRHFVPLEPLSTFLRALEASTLSEMGHSYRSLQRVLRTPYFVTDTQFVSYWEHKSTHQNMFPRYTLEKAFTAKEKVFDDLYVLWYILTHGPSDETQSFVLSIYTNVQNETVDKETPVPVRPPHQYIEDLLNCVPVDPLLQRWYANQMYPQLDPIVNAPVRQTFDFGEQDTFYSSVGRSSGGMDTQFYYSSPEISKDNSASPLYAPTSPRYAPTSPVYAPTSPMEYCPASPPPPPPPPSQVTSASSSLPRIMQSEISTSTVDTRHGPTKEVCNNGAPRYSPTSPAHRREDEEEEEVEEGNGVPYSPSSPAYAEETNTEEKYINVKSDKYFTQPQGGRYTPPHAQEE